MQRFAGGVANCALFAISLLVGVHPASAQATVPDRIVAPIQSAKVTALPGTVHPLALAQYDRGPVESSMEMHGLSLDFVPTAAQQASLAALLKAQQDPASPSYHKWLTPKQYADQFGMSAADIAKATTWLQGQGFTVDHVAESRNAIQFSGNVALVEAAFHTQIHRYDVNGESHFANASAVSLPSALAGTVYRVGGLNDFKPRPHIARPTGNLAHPDFTSGLSGSHYLAPGDFAVIYDLKPLYTAGYTGKGITIGIAGQTDIVPADITAFRSAAGLSVNNPTVFLIPGSSDPGISYNDLGEADLDLEWSGGTAPDASIVYVNSTNVLASLQYAIQNTINGVQIPIVSSSYGNCEPNFTTADLQSLEASFQQANAQGQTILNSTGDDGAADCDYSSSTTVITSATQGLQVDYPASSAYVTGLGGSEFMGDGTASNPSTGSDQYWSANGSTDVLTSALSYIPEMAWNDTTISIANQGGLSAGGGGASLLFKKPVWQSGVPGIPTDGARDLPDISLNASPYHDPYLVCTQTILSSNSSAGTYSSSCANGFRISDPGYSDDKGLTAYGGTSVAAPSFAGILAVIEQKLGAPQGLGNINPALYTLASSSSTYASAFHDITTGDNIVPCTSGTTNCPSSLQYGYSAGTGYDQATGLGSVDAANLATAFTTVAVKGGTTTSVAISPTAVTTGSGVTLTATVGANSGTTVPTGSVSFTVDGAFFTTVPISGGTAIATTSFSTGGPHTVVATYSGDDNFYESTSTTATINAAASGTAATITTVASSATSVVQNTNVTFTATVKSSIAGTIAGTVNFVIGSAVPITAAVTAGASGTGTASLTLATSTANGFAIGSNTVTATYNGDTLYAGSSGTASVTVTSPGSITITAANITIPSASPGNTGTSTITVTSAGGYTGTVNLTASAATLNANYAFASSSLAIPAGGSASTTISIQTIAAALQKGTGGNLQKTPANDHIIAGAAAAFGCIFLLGIPGFRKRRWPSVMAILLLCGLGAGLGCGGGSSASGAAPAGTYTVTVTAADSSNSAITASTNFTVTIQ